MEKIRIGTPHAILKDNPSPDSRANQQRDLKTETAEK
jgi:hypothetical protein